MLITKRAIQAHYDRYCGQLREQALSQSTRQCYASRASQFVGFLLSNFNDPLDIEGEAGRYCEVLQEELYAPSSINASLTVIEHFLSDLVQRPLKFARLELSKGQLRALSSEEQGRFLSSLGTYEPVRDRLLLLLLFHNGISIRCLADLDVQDLAITAHTGRIILRASSRADDSSLVTETLSLNEQTRRTALQWLIERHALVGEEESALFVNAKGQRISSAGAGHVVKKFGWRIQLELSGRILRNTYLANMAAAGRDLDEIKWESIGDDAQSMNENLLISSPSAILSTR